ncbi:DUF1990 family protein [Pseudactinotalea suaedae]|uniref:DUF1990 family protein n=1 Tax=Pseudactinotalea suaedae TaxID=1524924 RepID=UPI001391DD5A|nr:DUF1990 domain-containing protein [Pseudactinotalea suaedae]
MRPARLTLLPEVEAARLRTLDLTYPTGEVLPAGHRSFSRSAVIGQGRAAFEAAVEAVLHWRVQLHSGIAVAASEAAVELGSVARLRVPVGPLRLTAYCRVVEIVDEPDRGGFGYGTLPGHPESGKESFVVTIDSQEQVRLEITAFSRPASWYARLGGPVTDAAQDAMTERYLRALAAAARLPDAETARLRALDLTYPEVGGRPPGFWGYEMSGVIGRGRECFERAAAQVLAHEVFLRSGIGVASSRSTAELGSVLRVRIPVAFLRFTGFSRVVEVVDEPRRRGLAYGTLPGHPQSGREDLVVEIDEREVVRLHVTAFSRPVAWYARLGRPVARALQLRMARRFLHAIR